MTWTPIFQTIIRSFQDQFYPNANSIQHQNMIITAHKPEIGSTIGSNM